MELSASSLARAMAGPLEMGARLRRELDACDGEAELERCGKLGLRLLLRGEAGYPAALEALPDPPLLLYALGNAQDLPSAVSVVGTRAPTHYGRRMARALAAELAGAGLAVVSGLARGIDTEAHEGALTRRGPTWAFLGSGLARIFPVENEPLVYRIAEGGGCVLSEYPLDAEPLKPHFPRRNRLIAAMSWATVVVEAGQRSGALNTARRAIGLDRTVFAVPGPADSPQSAGPLGLLLEGAAMARGAQDILAHLPHDAVLAARASGPAPVLPGRALSLEYRKILDCIGSAAVSADELAVSLGLEVPKLSNILFEMELQGLVCPLPGQRYGKKN